MKVRVLGLVVAVLSMACGGESKPADAPAPASASASASAPAPGASAGAAASDGCSDKDGKTHAAGEKWSDGCNECSCAPTGSIRCTRRACEKP